MGVCLLSVQQAERMLADAVESVLKDRTSMPENLMEQTYKEQKRTLSGVLKELRKRAQIERVVDQRLWRFLEMRNSFVHNISEVPGWNLRTRKGREAAKKFLIELTMLAMAITGLFGCLFLVSAKDEFGKDLEEGSDMWRKEMARIMEMHFGTTARKILAGRRGKLVLVHSKD
jgi:hypothetical protein